MIDFEWDPNKASQNKRKHNVSFSEASTAFADPLSLTVFDPEHSETEDRFLLLGQATSGRLLVICHTDRGGTIRIINARLANRQERAQYESRE